MLLLLLLLLLLLSLLLLLLLFSNPATALPSLFFFSLSLSFLFFDKQTNNKKTFSVPPRQRNRRSPSRPLGNCCNPTDQPSVKFGIPPQLGLWDPSQIDPTRSIFGLDIVCCVQHCRGATSSGCAYAELCCCSSLTSCTRRPVVSQSQQTAAIRNVPASARHAQSSASTL